MKTKHQDTVIAYWLVPAKPERDFFNDVIRILGGQMKAPRFEPHVTLVVAPQDRHPPKKILERIKAAPIHLSVRGIGATSDFQRTLFVRLGSSKGLEKLSADVRRATKARGKNAASPHVSLLYKELPAATRRKLTSLVKLPFSQIVFDSIKAVRCPSSLRSRADVESWKVVATKSLRG
ncbi:MAG: 2'-5' RNA ligase family protein [Verrucomicrobiota bacterium]